MQTSLNHLQRSNHSLVDVPSGQCAHLRFYVRGRQRMQGSNTCANATSTTFIPTILTNANFGPLTNASFTAALTNMNVASPTIGGTCADVTNTPMLIAGATALNLSVPSLAVGSCSITLSLTSSMIGTQPLTTSGVTTTQTPVAGAASNTADLTVRSTPFPATISNTFTPAWIATGGISTLSFALTSPSAVPLTNATFTDTLNGMTVASPTIAGTCAGVTNSPALTVGAGALNVTVPTLPAAGCTITVEVTSAVLGSNANVTSGVTSTQTTTAGAASNTTYLTVNPVNTLFSYVHADHLGSPRAITRPSDNAVVWKWDNTDPFGANLPNENPSALGAFAYNLRFPGQYYDAETGTHYNYFRDYDPSTGRYVQSDPIGLGGGINTFAYVKSSPLTLIDPWGLLDLLVFDGRRLIGYDGTDVEFSVPAVSGPWGKGRLPAGTYRGDNLRRRTNKAMVCEDGNGWSLDLDPKFKTDRDLLRIHPDGNKPGTEGCIGPDCRYQQQVYDALRDYFNDKKNKQIPVIVVYPK